MSTNSEWNLGLWRPLSDSKKQIIRCGELCDTPPTSLFKEELVAQVAGMLLADGLQLSAPSKIDSATESCPVRGLTVLPRAAHIQWLMNVGILRSMDFLLHIYFNTQLKN